jgi:hypothetical protein
LAAWTFAPLIVTLVYISRHGGVLTGVNGADFFDQFQYLAWIRDEGSHVLASNLWATGPTPHDYLQPMYLISGLLWRAGLSIQLAYLIWKPVALVILFLGFLAYARRFVSFGPGARMAVLVLALFYECPLYALATWTGHLSTAHRTALILATDDATSALNLWGFDHTAIAIGLMPVFLIASERLIATGGNGGRVDRRWLATAAVAGLLVSWLQPWQGAVLLGVLAALAALRAPRRRYLVLAVPVLALVLPLAYGVLLARYDPSWRAFQHATTVTGTAPWWALLASFGPLVVLAAAGARRPRSDREWMLVLWPLACAAVYFIVPQFPPHALAGVMLPLSVLAVNGWRRARTRVRLPVRVVGAVAVACVLVVVVPAVVYHVQGLGDDTADTIGGQIAQQQFRLTPGQSAALDYLARARRPGSVLAPWLLSVSVPGFTGREAYAGHLQWQPASHVSLDVQFYSSGLSVALRRSILRRSGATFVIADCGAPAALARAIEPLAAPVRRFGCETVYGLRR